MWAYLSQNNMVASVALLLIGALITALVGALRNRTTTLDYSTVVQHFALAGDDQTLGKTQVIWQGTEVSGVHLATIDVANQTTRDVENLMLVVYTGTNTLLLNERTNIVGAPEILRWSDEYATAVAVKEGFAPTEAQFNYYYHRREYTIPVLNRRQTAQLVYLCTLAGGVSAPPELYVHSPTKGVRLRKQSGPWVLGIPQNTAIRAGLFVGLLTILASVCFFRSVWLAAIACMTVGLAAQMVGALMCKGLQSAKRWITG